MSTTSLLYWAHRQSPRELIQFARAGAVDKMTGAECYAVILALASKLEVALDAIDVLKRDRSLQLDYSAFHSACGSNPDETAMILEIERKLDAFIADNELGSGCTVEIKPGATVVNMANAELADRAAGFEVP